MDPVELAWTSTIDYADPYRDVEVTAAFTSPSGRRVEVPAFWDGGARWRARIALDEPGTWLYRVTASRRDDRGLHDRYGRCRCQLPAPPRSLSRDLTTRAGPERDPLPLVVDGSWEAWATLPAAEWGPYLGLRRLQGFTALQALLLPCRDARGRTSVTADGLRPSPGQFVEVEARMRAVRRHHLVPVLGLFAGEAWAGAAPSAPEAEALRLGRHLLARFAAFRPVWVLAVGANCTGAAGARWARVGAALCATDPGGPMGILPRGLVDPQLAEAPWLAFVAHQGPLGPLPPGRPRVVLNTLQRSRETPAQERYRLYGAILNGAAAVSLPPAPAAPLESPGTAAVRGLRRLLAALPGSALRPAPELVAASSGDPAPLAARSRDGQDIVVYVPVGSTLRLATGGLPARIAGRWINPGAGSWWRADLANLVPPAHGQDWLLHLRGEGCRLAS